ncbi:hypothetical protein ACRE_069970 [Hapsidospora chrysogenum ATCC 11550]|uniref:CHY-type domain-containing protein n=1 Tax=Hapsidospora chrysogenum (strain ATCC 11550 / CBS 779.69 / DSM 880 / IAM 14645 / JCM 23072 / IMI 49137) TaxID=857340 RepID=A0A086SYU1_HAPC1|nr:hypothetical protein ACRE_069970 [Hapsidospora chrysogenum ATCC 11550]
MIPLKTQPDSPPQTRRQAVGEPAPSRTVPKPLPSSQVQDPRRYQIEQLRRRYSPLVSTASDGATSLVFKLKPSDPDFPFELAHLDCDLRVPEDYPEERPVLLVRNRDIPRGFSINVERGWERLAEERKGATLLALTHALDKHLEAFLSEQKVETVKLVAFDGVKDTRQIGTPPPPPVTSAAGPVQPPATQAQAPQPRPIFPPEPSYTKDQISEAKARRAQEVRQLEARMGRTPMFRRSADGVVYTLILEPKRRAELPVGLSSVLSMHLIVPILYPLQDLRVQLNECDPEDAEPVEELFAQRAAGQKQMSLMSHVNYLAQNIHVLAKQAQAMQPEAETPEVSPEEASQKSTPAQAEAGRSEPRDKDKSHIQIIARPPEWSTGPDNIGSDDESTDSGDTDEGGGAALGQQRGEGDGAATAPRPDETPERGTMISFPSIELHGIELLQVSVLALTVKCERCKTVNEFKGLRPGQEKTDVCNKCNVPIAARFRQQLVHEHSTRAGFVDLAGCKVADMLPSTFVPTCARCSTPGLELVSVRGETVTNICRECHGKFTFKIPEVKFLLVTAGSLPPPSMAPRRRREEKLGLHAGEPLALRGTCAHYRKSYRWFRFSCCRRVHPCDRCHDDAEDHMNEWANRMICGWCSREQNYNPEACVFCGRSVIGRKGRGFWEGGKGTRDQALMSRKDPRKYKRIGGGAQASKKD